MKKSVLFVISIFILLFLTGTACTEKEAGLEEHPIIVTKNPFHSTYLENTALDICFPADYSEWKKYGVLYVHDPEKDANDLSLFDSEWICAHTLGVMNDSLEAKECVVVWIRTFYPDQGSDDFKQRFIALLTQEVKPFIEAEYNILPGRSSNFFASVDPALADSAFASGGAPFGGAASCNFADSSNSKRVIFRFLIHPEIYQ
ncbi:MAG: hypothetical protein RR202_04510 [Bacteroidales bacterium]